MKTTSLFFVMVIFTSSLFSFTLYPNGEMPEEIIMNEKTTDTLYAMGGWIKYDENFMMLFPFPSDELIFTGKDIISFNLTTREIVFTDSIPGNIGYTGFNIYYKNKLLLENIEVVRFSWSSRLTNDLVLYVNWDGNRRYRYYLFNGYPEVIYEGWNDAEKWRKEREANAEKRKERWDIFIKYLSDAGKIVGNTTNIEPAATPDFNAISIYPNPTTGKLKIENGELKIENVVLFDIHSRKIFNFQFSTFNSFDISHLPAGIYFVQITTEKGVVTKKVVKK